jgi:hypothetical protein
MHRLNSIFSAALVIGQAAVWAQTQAASAGAPRFPRTA